MGTAYLVAGLALACAIFAWLRRAKGARQRWLRMLGMPGTWVLQVLAAGASDTGSASVEPIVLGRLQLDGDLAAGRYRLELDRNRRWQGHWHADVEVEEGAWRLDGAHLEFRSLQEHRRSFELRLLAPGSLGLRQQDALNGYFALQREVNNVVELPRRAQSGR